MLSFPGLRQGLQTLFPGYCLKPAKLNICRQVQWRCQASSRNSLHGSARVQKLPEIAACHAGHMEAESPAKYLPVLFALCMMNLNQVVLPEKYALCRSIWSSLTAAENPERTRLMTSAAQQST